jgi:hypothetical protein
VRRPWSYLTPRLTLVVPDGVATVQFLMPRQPNRADPGAPIYRSVLTVLAPVHDNVAAVQVNRECCAGGVPMIWRAADGHVIKQIGDVADYRYTVTATACPQHTFPGGGGGGAGDLRGRVWSDSLTAVRDQPLCPGTYRVSVGVMDLGRYGPLKHPARPFGTATFTVRP